MSDLLPTDQYYIRNEESFAGRNRIEDKSAHPKAVYCPPPVPEQELWELERLPNGHYKLSVRGAPTGEIDKLLFAFIIEREKAEEWIITRQHSGGHRAVYTIEKADRTAGWVRERDEEEHHQIAVRYLTPTKSLPPQYPPNQLWNIQPLVD